MMINGSRIAEPVANKLPALGSGPGRDLVAEQNSAATLGNIKAARGLGDGLANTLTNPSTVAAPNKVEAGNVPGQQGLAGMLGNYRNMWQPNGGNNYQVVGGVGNII